MDYISPFDKKFQKSKKKLKEQIFDVNEILENWGNEDALNYARKLIEVYGEPDIISENQLTWLAGAIPPFSEVYIKDESIAHDFPVEHEDFVYSVMDIHMSAEQVGQLAFVSESILVDRLKDTVTARCGMLLKNAITLELVQDVVNGNLEPEMAREEYSTRIQENTVSEWWKDEMGELTPQ